MPERQYTPAPSPWDEEEEKNPCRPCKGTGKVNGKVCEPCGGTKRGPPSMEGSYTVEPVAVSDANQEAVMEKYAVVLDDKKTKTAGKDKNCPQCGGELTRDSYCPKCGTEPFEKLPEPPKK